VTELFGYLIYLQEQQQQQPGVSDITVRLPERATTIITTTIKTTTTGSQ
jgi:hypothetical protein